MGWRPYGGVVVVAAALALPGCGDGGDGACMQLSGASDVVARAAVLVLDVYGPEVDCAATAGVTAPLTRRFLAGQPITLAVPPGPHTFVLRAYADGAGTRELGQGCVETSLAPGADVCLTLDVAPMAGDGGGSSGSDGGVANDPCGGACGAGQACFPSCCAIPINADGAYAGDTSASTNQRNPSCDSPSGTSPDVTYAITATRDSTITVDTCANTDFDTILEVRSSCGGGTIRCSDDAGNCPGLGSRVSFAAQAGRTYYIIVDGYKRDQGRYTLTVSGL